MCKHISSDNVSDGFYLGGVTVGKAEDVVRARARAQSDSQDAEFRSQRETVFAKLDELLVGFADLAERAGYPDVKSVHLDGPNSWLVGWTLTEYDPDHASGAESHILASTGDLYINNFHFQDLDRRDFCAQRPESVSDVSDVVTALRMLRMGLEKGRSR